MMKYFLVSLILLSSHSLLAQSSNVETQSNKQLSAAVDDINMSIKSLKKDMKRVSKLLDNKAMLGLFQSLDNVSQDVDELRGMVEEQGHLQQGLQKRQRELYLDLDRRLREMELNAKAQPEVVKNPIKVPTIMPVITPKVVIEKTLAKASEAQQNKLTKEPKAMEPSVSAPIIVVKPVITAPPQPMSKERKDYQKSFDLLKEGRYNKAKTAFKSFLKKYPNSSYAGNAQYWSGEANYVTRQFATAMKEFKRVVTQYPGSNKVPDAMLKLGYTFYETRQMDNAKQILNELVKRFAKSTAARLAKKRLKRMKREGF